MQQSRRSRMRSVLILAILIPVLLIGGFAFYVANEAGELPWQEDPTAIPVVPFGGLDGIQPAATATVPPGSGD